MNRILGIAIITLFLITGFMTGTPGGESAHEESTEAETDYPNDWTHRPIVEHFTGLSCGPCMHGAHPDSTRLWEEEGYSEGYPWNYIEFHQLNGGGEDELMTVESRERMRFYQPVVSGAPDLEMDGGYVQCGGAHGSTAEANYEDIKEAIYDSGERDEIKKIDIRVGTIYDGTSFNINVEIDYLRNDEPFFPTIEKPLPDDTLHGTLYVFMMEDNVTAWSKTLEDYVLCHNVFRGYAIEDFEFEMEVGDSKGKMAVWEIPTTMIQDEEEGEIPIKVPVNPLNIVPIAVVYDLDDRSSGRGDESENSDGDGGDGSPRALNSATPATTTYDTQNEPPQISLKEPKSKGGKIQINALIEDDGGELAAAYVIYREAGRNDTNWKYKELIIEGSDCSGGICTIGNGEAYAVLGMSDKKKVEYSIMAYDSNWTRGSSEIAVVKISSSDDGVSSIAIAGGVVIFLGIIGAGLYILNSRKKTEEDLEDEEYIENMEDNEGINDQECPEGFAGEEGHTTEGPADLKGVSEAGETMESITE